MNYEECEWLELTVDELKEKLQPEINHFIECLGHDPGQYHLFAIEYSKVEKDEITSKDPYHTGMSIKMTRFNYPDDLDLAVENYFFSKENYPSKITRALPIIKKKLK